MAKVQVQIQICVPNNCSTCASNSGGKSLKMDDPQVLEKLEQGFQKLQKAESKSLLKKYLTPAVFDSLKNKKTELGATLLDVIQSGLENLDSGIGIYAPDADSYSVFGELFDPIIDDYHGGFKKDDKHPKSDFGDLDSFVNVDPDGQYVISTRVRCGRSLEGKIVIPRSKFKKLLPVVDFSRTNYNPHFSQVIHLTLA